MRKRLGEMLIEAGVIDEVQLQAALGHQRRWGGRIGQALVHLNLAREEDVVAALGRKFGYEVARLEPDALEPYGLQQALALVPREVAVRNHLLPIAADSSTLTVAMSDPTNVEIVDELRFRTGRRIVVKIAGEIAIADALKIHYPAAAGAGVDAIPLDLDEGAEERIDALLDPFGGGSSDELEAFFSARSEPRAAAPPAAAPARVDPFALDLEEATPPGGRAVPSRAPAPQPAAVRPAAGPELAPLEELPPEDLIPEDALEPDAPSYFDAGPVEPARSADAGARLTEEELAALDAIDRIASGLPVERPTIVKPERIAAALVRLLIRKGIVTDEEFLEELMRQ